MALVLSQVRLYGTVLLAAVALLVLLPFHFAALYLSEGSPMRVARLWSVTTT